MPQKKAAARGAYRPSTKPRKASKVEIRRAFDNLAFNWAQLGAAMLAEIQIERREHALGLIDYRNELSKVARKTRELRIYCRCVGDCCPCPSKRDARLVNDIKNQIELVDERLRQYTETYRPDWLASARNGETLLDAVTRILAEHNVKPHRKGHRRDRTKERQVERLRRALVARRKHAQLELARVKQGHVAVNRWDDEVSAEQLRAEIARLTRLIGKERAAPKRGDKLSRLDEVAALERQMRMREELAA